MKKVLAGAFALGLLAGVAHAEDKYTIAVSIPAADHGWTGGVVFHATQEAKSLEKQYPGLKVIVKTSPDGAAQANALEDLTTQGINALVVLPHNPDELTDPIKKVKDKGVFITVVDRALRDRSIEDLYVAGNNPELGRVAGDYIKKQLGGKGDVVVIQGLPIPINEQRVNAFKDAIKGSDIKILDSQFGNWSRDDAFKVMQDFLTKYPHIDAVWCQDDDMAISVLEALKQAKRTDVKLVGGRRRRHEGDRPEGDERRSAGAGRRAVLALDGRRRDGRHRRRPGQQAAGARQLHPQRDAGDQRERERILFRGFAVLIER